jgi:RNA polymerase sigma-70 factor, ECF subfamily
MVTAVLPEAAAGADLALELLYRDHARCVSRYALAVLRDRSDAEDVTQTTFLNAYRALRRGERPRNPDFWLIAIARNACRERIRLGQRRPREVVFDEEVGAAPEVDGDAPTADELRQALLRLPENQRSALVMRALEGRSCAEIAEVLGVSRSAVETLLFRARRTLRSQLEEQLSCGEAAVAISRQLEGMLAHSEREGLRGHLRGCPECARLARSRRARRAALRG